VMHAGALFAVLFFSRTAISFTADGDAATTL
jgi:hypothetical protein